jgi:ATPase family associated with various cellular activities (AAA)
MKQVAIPVWSEINHALLVHEFARLEALLGGSRTSVGRWSEADWECDAPPAIDQLATAFDLSAFERDLLLLCAGAEMNSDLHELCSRLTGKPQRGCPTFALAMSALAEPEWGAMSPWGPLRRYRLVETDPSQGLATAPLRINERTLHYLAGINRLDKHLEAILRPRPPAALLSQEHEQLVEQLAGVESGDLRAIAVQLHGDDAVAQENIAARFAHLHGRSLLVMQIEDCPAAGAELEDFLAIWSREVELLPAFLLLQWSSETSTAAAKSLADRLPGPLLVASRDPLRLRRSAWRMEVNKPAPAEQRRLWAQALEESCGLTEDGPENAHDGTAEPAPSPASCTGEMLDRLAGHFRLSAPTIAAIAEAAGNASAAHAGPQFASRLWQSCRVVARPQLDLLAERIAPRACWGDLVLPAAQIEVLSLLAAEARYRMVVYERWGFARRGRRGLGLSALFSGPSGTGKTLAAEVVAAELSLDLYRIDLSAVVSKYIGETEKNLKRVFDAAEEGGVVLLFDEAEALFGKRTEVRDSHDRHANIEVGYLLQRMENYQGVAILTTNLKSTLDQAFQRRLRFIIDFPFPGKAEREAIWKGAIPPEAPRQALDNARLAQLNVTGGSIRNIALNAAFLAAAEGRAVGMEDLLRAAQLEASKQERPITESETRGWV